jgi:hypothetical protein
LKTARLFADLFLILIQFFLLVNTFSGMAQNSFEKLIVDVCHFHTYREMCRPIGREEKEAFNPLSLNELDRFKIFWCEAT